MNYSFENDDHALSQIECHQSCSFLGELSNIYQYNTLYTRELNDKNTDYTTIILYDTGISS